ncbi:hypothetical protein K488DRAFT_70606 [Vararia minispora EC-137]|uniref:Uncharacterized protein n=1 Tax=Vararia minispora EC-137 TaxID=1314806 RepID=A0ACB8QL63_9AGAM|nr:hypothetical protein K488DRAFT_70606 [Vararia minispora EC-137]
MRGTAQEELLCTSAFNVHASLLEYHTDVDDRDKDDMTALGITQGDVAVRAGEETLVGVGGNSTITYGPTANRRLLRRQRDLNALRSRRTEIGLNQCKTHERERTLIEWSGVVAEVGVDMSFSLLKLAQRTASSHYFELEDFGQNGHAHSHNAEPSDMANSRVTRTKNLSPEQCPSCHKRS